jgi:transposase
MTNVKQKVDYAGKTIFVGMDVHKNSWNISLYFEQQYLRSFHQPPAPSALAKTLQRDYPNATFRCAYEAGFSGFWIQRELSKLGLECIVVNAADIPQTDKWKKNKTDRNDSKRIGSSLEAGQLIPIHVPDLETDADRRLVRYRQQLIRDLTRAKLRIKSLLLYNGIDIPPQFSSGKWSNLFVDWLKNIELSQASLKSTLQRMITQVEILRQELNALNKQVKDLLNSDRYRKTGQLLQSVPGIGAVVAITLLVEIGDIHRFSSFTQFNSFIGFCPTEQSTGETERKGNITTRSHSVLRSLLVESAWTAIKADPALTLTFSELKKRITAKRAIIRIARKLLNRIWHVWTKTQEYEKGIVI